METTPGELGESNAALAQNADAAKNLSGTGNLSPLPLEVPVEKGARLTHYLFRYPAKFHPPVVAALLDRYTAEGQTIFDPFVGSGTALVEAMILGRRALGIDVDPVAVEVAQAKTRRYQIDEVREAFGEFLREIEPLERSVQEYQDRALNDLSDDEYGKVVLDEGLWVPAIPRLHHWFRRYVTIDLSRILRVVNDIETDSRTRLLLRVTFSSIIRNASNADPVPVSGLEYTSYMRKRDELGRIVNPFGLIRSAVRKALRAVSDLADVLPEDVDEPRIQLGDATSLSHDLPSPIDAVLTSPPYHGAVDYYRRHQLEMYWMGHVSSHEERLHLLTHYIGRPKIAMKDPVLALPWVPPALTHKWEAKIREVSPRRADGFRHYTHTMAKCMSEIARVTRPGAPVLIVVGHSTWNGYEIPTGLLFEELAPELTLREILDYPIKNRYMSYERHNNASIDREYVLVFKRD